MSVAAPSSSFWIDFEEARNAVETIVDVAHDDPEERPTCIVLTGQSGMGKTSILREAQRRLAEAFPEPADWGEARYQPVLRTVQLDRHDAAGIVNPARFFDELRRAMPDDGILAVDDGNHTFLTAELMPIHAAKSVILPTDFNCMGYAVPAAIGAKLGFPDRSVQAIVGAVRGRSWGESGACWGHRARRSNGPCPPVGEGV